MSTTAPERVRPAWWPRRPPHVDIAIALVFVALGLAELVGVEPIRSPVEHALTAALPLGVLAWRRQFPVAVTAVIVAVQLAVDRELQFTIVLTLVLCLSTVGFEARPPRSYVGLAIALTPFLVVSAAENGFLPSDYAAAGVFIVGPWLVGSYLRRRTELDRAAVAAAEQRARDQERRAAEAAEQERSRIARELHDIVSHSISVITIQAQAVRRRLGDEHPDEVADLVRMETAAREAMAEMRRLFGVLRSDKEAADLAPQPGVSELDTLVAGVPTDGPTVELHTEGESQLLPPGLDLAAYRVAQEGLTNALRHAAASRVVLTLRYEPDSLTVEVVDDGRGDARSGTPGHGLIGVRERAALYGGTVDLTDVPAGGTRLRVRLPMTPTPGGGRST
ncbi:sensor histidine kinase [Nocardioides coralli]|uniref:sensor histidine kinase n=1 Tax=Nocardioides coralli TaxID=2872154 RepID=UPI001CA45DD8|nr:sensor histidine kinase [Nocardioides coralli]QZY29602.1 sensor histidine kinase [Nocardioides coralli]